ncbi:MAG: hypothetical protein WCO33_04195 [bacterium]
MNPNDNTQGTQNTSSDWQQMSDTNQTSTPLTDPTLATPMSLPGDDQGQSMAQGYPATEPNLMPSETPMNGSQFPVTEPQMDSVQPEPAVMEPMQQATGPQTLSDGSEAIPRDPNVLNFMIQTVQEKNKDATPDPVFVQKEAERLYDEFGEKLVDYFEPMLSKEQVEQFDKLMSEGTSQDQLLAFLMSCIPDLTQQIEKVLIEFKEKYIYGF